MAFRRPYEQDRFLGNRSPRRFRQAEYEGDYAESGRRARPGDRGFGWARRRDIDDTASQQMAPRGGGRYDRTGEDQYAEGLEAFEQGGDYRAGGAGRWQLDEGGVEFGQRGWRAGDDRYADPSRRGGGLGGGYGRGELPRGVAEDDYGRWGGRGGGQSAYGRGFGGEFAGPDDCSRAIYGARAERSGHRGRGPRGYQRSDERIREDVCDLLTDDDAIDASEIEIEVQSGTVVLTGTVDSRDTKRQAEDVAESVTGVREVQNNLRVRSQAGQFGSFASAPQPARQAGGVASAQQTRDGDSADKRSGSSRS